MATPSIPTRIRQNIRDQFTSEDAPFKSTAAELAVTLGYPVSLDPEWGMLWLTLHSYFPDQATFVPNVVSVVTMWCRAFKGWLEDEGNESAVERLLDALKGVGSLRLEIEVTPTQPRPTTTWRPSTRSFVISLAKARPSSAQTVLAGFSSDLLQLFTQSPSLLATSPVAPDQSTTSISRASTSAIDDPEAWAELSLDNSPMTRPLAGPSDSSARGATETGIRTTATTTTRNTRDLPVAAASDFLPDVNTLERPEELSQRAPYRLIVRQEGRQRILVECSHMGTLKVLEAYLTRWVRGNVDLVNRPPLADIRLRESLFGLGLWYDTLIVEAGRHRELNALLVLTVVENVLGYELVPGGGGGGAAQGGVWEFRRGTGFT